MALPERFGFARRVLVAALVLLGVFGVVALVVRTAAVLLLGFGGVLFGVLLDGLASVITRRTPIPRGWALGLVVLGLVTVVGTAVGVGGPMVAAQMGELQESIAGGLEAVRERADAIPGLGDAVDELGRSGGQLAQRLAGAFATVLGGFTSLLIILVIGVYLAINPKLYQRAVLHLVHRKYRPRGREVLAALGHALRSWLLGQFLAMIFVGTLATVGLLLLGVPLAPLLGLLAFLFEFVPYLGPIAGAIPAVLVALTVSPELALYTAILFGAIQLLESNVVTPLIQQQVVHLPPAFLIFTEVVLGALAGVVGIALSAPLGVAFVVLVQMLYVQDVLGDEVRVLGEDDEEGREGATEAPG